MKWNDGLNALYVAVMNAFHTRALDKANCIRALEEIEKIAGSLPGNEGAESCITTWEEVE